MRGYQKHVISAEAPGPMSREELEREEIRAQEASTAGVDSKAAVVSGKFLNNDTDFTVFLSAMSLRRISKNLDSCPLPPSSLRQNLDKSINSFQIQTS